MYDAIGSRYTYKNSNVIKNKLNIKDEVKLHEYETEMVAFKLVTLRNIDMSEYEFDAKRLRFIHKYLFEDIYEFAGEYRLENITKDNFMFAQFEYIEENVESIMNKISIPELKKMDYDALVEKISYFLTELNVLHPFREGNGRTIREFIRQILYELGYDINFSEIPYEEVIRASKLAIVDDSEQILLLKNSIKKL